MGNTAQHQRLGLSKDSDLAGDLEDSKIDLGENLVHLQESNIRSHRLDVQEANFHSSTESEAVSLHAARRMDGLPALNLWDLVVEVLHSSLHQPRTRGNLLLDKHCEKHSNVRTKRTV